MATSHVKLNEGARAGADQVERHLAALERAYQRALRAAGFRASRAFQAAARIGNATAPALLTAAADITSRSAMVALYPRPAEAKALAEDGGEDPTAMHITLAYLGEITPDRAQKVAAALANVALLHPVLVGHVGGVGTFDDLGNGVPAILLPDVPGLVELRQAVCDAILATGADYSRDHGYTPHLTVAYREDDTAPPARDGLGDSLHFDALHIVQGDAPVAVHPLTGTRAVTAAADPKWTPPPVGQVFDSQQLADDTEQKTAKLHRAILETAGSAALEPFGIAFDVTAPVPQALLAQVGKRVQDGIADAIQAQIVDAIQTGYAEGHSVATVAAAIRTATSEIAKPRAQMLARTDLNALANGGSLAAASLAGAAQFKVWTTAEDDRVRDTHQAADGQTVPIDAPFDVGGEEAQYPGDPDLSDEEACNCRCTITYSDSLAAAAPAVVVSPAADGAARALLAELSESRAAAARAQERTFDMLGRLLEASSSPQQVPAVHVYVPEQPPSVVNVTVPEREVVVNVPEQASPVVHVAAAPPPDVHVHVPEQPAPVVAAAPAPVTAVRVEVDKRGTKTYIPVRDP